MVAVSITSINITMLVLLWILKSYFGTVGGISLHSTCITTRLLYYLKCNMAQVGLYSVHSLNSSVFWVITLRKTVWYRRFGTTSVPSSRVKQCKSRGGSPRSRVLAVLNSELCCTAALIPKELGQTCNHLANRQSNACTRRNTITDSEHAA